ncbi:MAG: glycosyltransferase family 61 protein, partial [Chloroflexota bacterium]|nr:glycosyltransferase family 61 protein [Chloroflexota bacterium]
MGFEEQLELYGSCSVIAGPAGSNMHNSAFMPRKTHVIILAPTSFVVEADYLINAAKDIQLNYYFTDV